MNLQQEVDRRVKLRTAILESKGIGNQADLAKRYGISKQRVWQLVHEYPDFPPAVAEVGGRPVWALGEVDEWQASRLENPRRRAA